MWQNMLWAALRPSLREDPLTAQSVNAWGASSFDPPQTTICMSLWDKPPNTRFYLQVLVALHALHQDATLSKLMAGDAEALSSLCGALGHILGSTAYQEFHGARTNSHPCGAATAAQPSAA